MYLANHVTGTDIPDFDNPILIAGKNIEIIRGKD